MSTVNADLSTLEALYNVLKADVDYAHSILSDTDTALENTVWESPNAQTFRDSWSSFRTTLIRMEMACADAANDVVKNHTELVTANGVTDTPTLSTVNPYEVI